MPPLRRRGQYPHSGWRLGKIHTKKAGHSKVGCLFEESEKIEYNTFDIIALLFLGAIAGFISAGFVFKMATDAAEFWVVAGAVSTAVIPLVIFLISKNDWKKIQQEALKGRDLKNLKEFVNKEMVPFVKKCQKESREDNVRRDRIRALAQLWSKLSNLAQDTYYEERAVNLNLEITSLFEIYNKYKSRYPEAALYDLISEAIRCTEDVYSIIRSKRIYEYKYKTPKENIAIFNQSLNP